MVDLDKLREITEELANEIHDEERGKIWDLVTLIFDNVDSPVCIFDNECNILYLNPRTIIGLGRVGQDGNEWIGKNAKDTDGCNNLDCDTCKIKKVLCSRKVETVTYCSPYSDEKFNMVCIPLIYNGTSGVITILGDINYA
jgi:hypothetical protein